MSYTVVYPNGIDLAYAGDIGDMNPESSVMSAVQYLEYAVGVMSVIAASGTTQTLAPDLSQGEIFEYVFPSNAGGFIFTLGIPINGPIWKGRKIGVSFNNAFGTSSNTITLAYVAPGGFGVRGGPASVNAGKYSGAQYVYDGTNWVCIGQSLNI